MTTLLLDGAISMMLDRRVAPVLAARGIVARGSSLDQIIHYLHEQLRAWAVTVHIPLLHHALQEALARGVTVTAVVRPEESPADRYPDPSTRSLLDRGMTLRGFERLHAKGIVVDGSRCGLFSANINPFSLQSNTESAHVECGVFTDLGSSLPQAYAQFIQEMDQQATHVYRR